MSSYPVERNWKVYVDSDEISYLEIDFTKTHPSEYPDTFTIRLAGTQTGINYWDTVEIKKDDVTRFFGYVETKHWDSNKDTIIGGRCRKLAAWKKWTERFIESRGDLAGFFGYVDGAELFKFLIRCPISDFPTEDEETWEEYPRHKVGWGISTKLWDARTNNSAVGANPMYAILRLLEFYWRNRGTDSAADVLYPDGGTSGDWSDSGGGGCSGYGCLDDCSDDAEYIYSGTNGDVAGPYTFDDLAGTATGINSVKLRLRLRRTTGWWGSVTVKVEVYDGSDWYISGYVTIGTVMTWGYVTFHPTHILNTVDKVNAAQVRLTRYSGVEMGVHINCSCLELIVDYSDSGTQEIGDYFEVDFNETRGRVCGVLIQSRASPDQYPENYCIDKYVESGDENFNDGEWTVYDPATTGNVSIASAIHIDHDQYRNEDTGVYKDFGADFFTDFTHKFAFKTEAVIPQDVVDDLGPVFTPYALTNTVDDLYAIDTASGDYICLYVHYRTSPPTGPTIALRVSNGGSGQISYSSTITGNTWYYCEVTKSGRAVTCDIRDESGTVLDSLSVTIPTSDISLRYLWAGITWNTSLNLNCDGDIEYFNLGNWVELVCETDHACQDILHSWTPALMSKIRIRITVQDTTRSWEISQIYVYESDVHEYCVVDDR